MKLKNVDPLVEVCSDIMSKRGGSSFVDISDESNALKFIQKSIQDLDIDNNIMKDENKSQKVTLYSLREELIKKQSIIDEIILHNKNLKDELDKL